MAVRRRGISYDYQQENMYLHRKRGSPACIIMQSHLSVMLEEGARQGADSARDGIGLLNNMDGKIRHVRIMRIPFNSNFIFHLHH
jgi:hypothetical protein